MRNRCHERDRCIMCRVPPSPDLIDMFEGMAEHLRHDTRSAGCAHLAVMYLNVWLPWTPTCHVRHGHLLMCPPGICRTPGGQPLLKKTWTKFLPRGYRPHLGVEGAVAENPVSHFQKSSQFLRGEGGASAPTKQKPDSKHSTAGTERPSEGQTPNLGSTG